jgi:hypothetical protein
LRPPESRPVNEQTFADRLRERISPEARRGFGIDPPQRQVNEQTLAELRSISAELPEQQMVARAVRGPRDETPAGALTDAQRIDVARRSAGMSFEEAVRQGRITQEEFKRYTNPREGILGGSREARELFQTHIAPHQDEATFVQSYFNGAYTPSTRLKRIEEYGAGKGLEFDGDLVLNGNRLGSMQRQIFPEAGYAYNKTLFLKRDAQGGGFTKGLLANQFGLYRQMGLERVDVFASVDLGGYSWAKYGFLPTGRDWYALKSPVGIRLNQMRKVMSPDDYEIAMAHLSSPDPRSIWRLSDMTNPIPHPSLKNPTVGKGLLAGMDWHGEFHLNNPQQNGRFDDYVAKR